MPPPGRVYRRGRIFYIAYRWHGREYRSVAGRRPMATLRIRPGLRNSDKIPKSSRSPTRRFGARRRDRPQTMSCCLSSRFSLMTARTPPGRQTFKTVTARCRRTSRRSFIDETA